jgi:hypothetical protein
LRPCTPFCAFGGASCSCQIEEEGDRLCYFLVQLEQRHGGGFWCGVGWLQQPPIFIAIYDVPNGDTVPAAGVTFDKESIYLSSARKTDGNWY